MTNKYKNTPVLGYRSKKEQRFAELLVEAGIPYGYETEKFILQNKFKQPHYARFGKRFKLLESVRAITFTPDFIIHKNGVKYIVEIKGFKTGPYAIKKKLFLYWLHTHHPEHMFIELNSVGEMKTFIQLLNNNYDG
jgi:predicted nuclease of restriction endonuclease-like RecB superfamily